MAIISSMNGAISLHTMNVTYLNSFFVIDVNNWTIKIADELNICQKLKKFITKNISHLTYRKSYVLLTSRSEHALYLN